MRCGGVGNVYRPGVDYCSTSRMCPRHDLWRHEGNRTMVSHGTMLIALYQPDDDVVCSAKARGALRYCIEHGLGVVRRSADDAQNLRGGRLLLFRLEQIGAKFPDLLRRSRASRHGALECGNAFL